MKEKSELWNDLVSLCKGFNFLPTDENVVSMMVFVLEKNKEKRMEHHPDLCDSDTQAMIDHNCRKMSDEMKNKEKHHIVEANYSNTKQSMDDEIFKSMLKKEELKKFYTESNLIERLRKIVNIYAENNSSKNCKLRIAIDFELDLKDSYLDEYTIYSCDDSKHINIDEIHASSLEEAIQNLEKEYLQSEFIVKNGKRYRLVEDNG